MLRAGTDPAILHPLDRAVQPRSPAANRTVTSSATPRGATPGHCLCRVGQHLVLGNQRAIPKAKGGSSARSGLLLRRQTYRPPGPIPVARQQLVGLLGAVAAGVVVGKIGFHLRPGVE